MSEPEIEFDNEADRRDDIRQRLIKKVIEMVRREIGEHGATGTPEEHRWLEVTIARRLLRDQELEARSHMYRAEIKAAEKEIEK